MIDGIQIKIKEHNIVTSKAALIALAIDDEGYRDILAKLAIKIFVKYASLNVFLLPKYRLI